MKRGRHRKNIDMTYDQWRAMIDSNKSLRNSFGNLRQQVLEMRHYWKIRCKERNTLVKDMEKYRRRLSHLLELEETIARTFGRAHLTIQKSNTVNKKGNRVYPVFLTRNDITRLRFLLRRIRKITERRI